MADGLLSFEAARDRLIALARPLPAEEVPIASAAGRRPAAPLVARLTRPDAPTSAMDGYALAFADAGQPLAIVGEAPAGRPFPRRLGRGEAVRIFTGGHLPPGADCVALQEDARVADGMLTLPAGAVSGPGDHVRAQAADFAAGDPLWPAGRALTPAALGLLASAGHASIAVHRKPRVALISTGDELVAPGMTPAPGQAVAANALALAALLEGHGAEIVAMPLVGDDLEVLERTLADAAARADLVVPIGGASVGDHDLVRPALASLGADIDFWRVALRPGKPLFAGRLGEAAVVGLPGNLASAFVCARLFLVVLLRAMGGASDPLDCWIDARLTTPLGANGPRAHAMRARLEDCGLERCVTPDPRQDSALASVLARADCLLWRPPHAGPLPADATVPVLAF